MEVRTSLGYVTVRRGPGRWWEVRRGSYRASSEDLSRALRFVGLGAPDVDAIESRIFARARPFTRGARASMPPSR